MPTQRRRPLFLRWPVWATYAVLFAVAVPWYWPKEHTSVLFGVPLWVLVTLGASGALSCFTAWLLIAGWPSDEELEAD